MLGIKQLGGALKALDLFLRKTQNNEPNYLYNLYYKDIYCTEECNEYTMLHIQ